MIAKITRQARWCASWRVIEQAGPLYLIRSGYRARNADRMFHIQDTPDRDMTRQALWQCYGQKRYAEARERLYAMAYERGFRWAS